MSIAKLIEDEYKPWCSGRVNNLTIDGTYTGPAPGAGSYVQGDFDLTVGGDFVVTPFDINIRYTKVGNLMFMSLPVFSITPANQTVVDGEIVLSGLPIDFLPNADYLYFANYTINTTNFVGQMNISQSNSEFRIKPLNSLFTKDVFDITIRLAATYIYTTL